jgi:hypothetical protein
VVFEDRADSWCLRLLRPGFRHCFCVIGIEGLWLICDPLKTRIEHNLVRGLEESTLADCLALPGRTVLRGAVGPAVGTGRLRLRPLTCVEIVARSLNLDSSGVHTPSQLYRRLLLPPPPMAPYRPHIVLG